MRITAVVLGLSLVAACGPAERKPTSTTPGSRRRAAPKPPPPRITLAADQLPIPEEYALYAISLDKVRATNLYKKLRTHLLRALHAAMGKAGLPRAPWTRCRLDVERDLARVTVGMSPTPPARAGIVLLQLKRDAAPLLACLKRTTPSGWTAKPVRLDRLRGQRWQRGSGAAHELWVLGPRRLLYVAQRSARDLRQVLTGELNPLSRTPLYRAARGRSKVAPAGLLVLPSIRSGQPSPGPGFLRILAIALRAELAGGALQLRGILPAGDDKSADNLVRFFPMLANAMRKQSPLLGALVAKTKLTRDPTDRTVVRMATDLSATDLKPFVAALKKLLGKLQGSAPRPSP